MSQRDGAEQALAASDRRLAAQSEALTALTAYQTSGADPFDVPPNGRVASAVAQASGSGQAAGAPRSSDVLVTPLTARELEILRLIAAGMRNQEIARQLFISPATVKRHIANAYQKLGAGHRTEALVRARDLKLL